MKAILLLKDGRQFIGEGFGASATVVGEVVFNTGMSGYQEILTDPSYKGQMVTMTYPHIGNYGINSKDVESTIPHVEAFIVREMCNIPSNFRSEESLDAYLKRFNIPGIHDIDTRALTRHIRDQGAMMGILSTETDDVEALKKQLDEAPGIVGQDLVQHVTIPEACPWNEPIENEWYYDEIKPYGNDRFHVVAFDFGMKHNICRLLTSYGMNVTVVPASATAKDVKALKPDGIFLSNGPGDPEGIPYAIKVVSELVREYPTFGICLGHQILGLAMGAKSYKLKFGHHGCNHPVKNLATGEIEITSQNHNFALDVESVKALGFEITHMNLNDHTLEGMQHKELPLYSIQYHPEASPGPHDSHYLFRNFYELMMKQK